MKKLFAILALAVAVCLPSSAAHAQAPYLLRAPTFVPTNGSLVHWPGFFGAPNLTNYTGSTGTSWQVGAGGPQLVVDSGGLDAKNAAGSSLVILRGATPSASTDLTPKSYVDTASTVTGSGFFHATSGTKDSAANKGTAGQFAITLAGATDVGWASCSGDASCSTSTPGAFTITGLRGSSVPTPASGYLQWNGSAFVWTTPAGAGVTGSGVWHSTSGALDSAASHGTAGQGLWTTAAGTDTAWASCSGDVTCSTSTPGLFTLGTSGVTAGSYGSGTLIPVFTLDAKGRVTVASTTTVTAALGSATGILGAANGGSGVASPTAHTVPINEGSSAYSNVSLGAGQLIVGQSAADPQAKTVSGDATFANTGALTLATVNLNTGTFGSGTAIPQVTVNGKGLITAAGTVGISPLTMGGDVTGTTAASVVGGISSTSTVPIAAPTLQFGSTVATPTISQASTTSATANSMHMASQASTATNGTPGSLFLDLPAPTGTGTEAVGGVTRNGSTIFAVGAYQGSSSISDPIWAGPNANARTTTNQVIDARANDAWFNGPSGTGHLYQSITMTPIVDGSATDYIIQTARASTSNVSFFTSAPNGGKGVLTLGDANTIPTAAAGSGSLNLYSNTHVLETNGAGIQFNRLVATPFVTIATQTTDRAVPELDIVGGSAFASATSNPNAGNVFVKGGTGVGVGGSKGAGGILSGDLNTELAAVPGGTLFTNLQGSGGSSFQYQQSGATGTTNTQAGYEHAWVGYGRITTNGGSFTSSDPSPFTITNGQQITLRCRVLMKVVVAGASTAVGDLFTEEWDYNGYYNGTSFAAVGNIDVPTGGIVTKTHSSSINSTSTQVTFNLSASAPGCVFTAVAASGTLGTVDATVWSRLSVN